jgi:hypothetical protein
LDDDGDGINDCDVPRGGLPIPPDKCPTVRNPGQEDTDGDHVGDACDDCPGTLPGASVDADGCSCLQLDETGSERCRA